MEGIEYLPYYVGCKCSTPYGGATLITISPLLVAESSEYYAYVELSSGHIAMPSLGDIRLHLKPFDVKSLSHEELSRLGEIIDFEKNFADIENGYDYEYSEVGRGFMEQKFDYEYPLMPIRAAFVTRYLTSKSIDVFGLIDEGKACEINLTPVTE